MKVVKKLNNNVAECIDGNGNHLIAFGKGIGFPKMPYELKDLSLISMTFYKLNDHFEKIITELPENILNLSVEIVEMAQKELKGQLNPALVFSLADHIHFAIQRMTNYQNVKLAFSHEVEKLYPEENQLAEQAVKMINRSLNVYLPKNEVTSIAVHFLNSQSEFKITQEEALIEEIVNNVTKVIEEELTIIIDKDEFNYNRFRTHMVYYLKQIRRYCQ